jgi:hypothetical protein
MKTSRYSFTMAVGLLLLPVVSVLAAPKTTTKQEPNAAAIQKDTKVRKDPGSVKSIVEDLAAASVSWYHPGDVGYKAKGTVKNVGGAASSTGRKATIQQNQGGKWVTLVAKDIPSIKKGASFSFDSQMVNEKSPMPGLRLVISPSANDKNTGNDTKEIAAK